MADQPREEPATEAAAELRRWLVEWSAFRGDSVATLNRYLVDIEAEAAAHATEGADPLTAWERSDLPRHTEDGNGGCLVCREWTGEFDEDGEMTTTIMSWPCAKVRLAAIETSPPSGWTGAADSTR